MNIFNTEHNVQSIKTIQSEYKYAHRSVLVHGIPETSRTSQNICYSIRTYVYMYFCTLQFVKFLVSTSAQLSKPILSGGGLELPSLGGSSPRAEGGISWEYAEDS